MNGTFIRLQTEFTDPAIPKLYRDKVITTGTKYCFDARDEYSFVKQSAPSAGVDAWINLKEGGAAAAFNGVIDFTGGGFTFSAGGNDFIALPATGVAVASAHAFVTTLWIKLGTPAPASSQGIFGASDNFNDDKNQYSAHFFSNAGVAELKLYQGSKSATALVNPDSNRIVQLGWSAKKRSSDGKYDLKFYLDGAVFNTAISAGTTLPVPLANSVPRIGTLNGSVGVDWSGRAYRTFFDDCSVKSAEALVALDYAENMGRIATL